MRLPLGFSLQDTYCANDVALHRAAPRRFRQQGAGWAMFSAAALLYSACTTTALAQTCSASQLGNPCAQGDVASQGNPTPGDDLGIGNPIHLATGNKYLFELDVQPLPHAPWLTLSRHYNSLDPRHGSLGRGWTLNYDVRLLIRGQGVQILQADGSRVDFPLPQRRASTHTRRGRLQRHEQGWTWQWPTGQQLHFNHEGWLVAMQDAIPRPSAIHIQRHHTGLLRGHISHLHDAQGGEARLHYRIAAGQAYLASVVTPMGRWQYHYDAPGPGPALRLLAVTWPDGMQRRYHYEADKQGGNAWLPTGIAISRHAHAPAQRLRRWHYDSQGRVIQAWQSPAPTQDTVQVSYPAIARHGRDGQTRLLTPGGRKLNWHTQLKQGTYRLPAATLTIGKGTPDAPEGWPGLTMTYDALGRRNYWHSPLTGHHTLHYDAQGRLERILHADSAQRHYRYDDKHRLQSLQVHRGQAQEETRLLWRQSLLTSIEHPAEQERLNYDEQGRLRQREIQRPGLPEQGLQALHYQEGFEYDAQGRLTTHHLPEGGSLHYQWSSPHVLRLIWQDRQGKRHDVVANDAHLTGFQHGNGLRTYSHVQHHRQHWAVYDGRQPLWVQLRQQDHLGLVTHLADWFGTQSTGMGWRFHYDKAQRLSRAMPVILPAALHHAAASLSARHTPRDPRHHRWYAWHADGGLAATRHQHLTQQPDITRHDDGLPARVGTLRLHYGPGGRLQQATDAHGKTAHYTHNTHGYRLSARHDGQTTQYLYVGHKLAAEIQTGTSIASAGTPSATRHPPRPATHDTLTARHITRRYLYAGQAVVGLIDYGPDTPDGQLFAVHTDPLGTPRLLTDAQRRVRWLGSYSPTGELIYQWGDMQLDLRLPGQIADAFTGWHDNLLRTYAPDLGAYLEPDPLGPLPKQQALGYARQQPQRYIDPSGLILFAFDGTRQNAFTQANVWKLAQRYADGPVHYHPGPGNPYYLNNDALVASQADRILDTQWQRLLDTLRAAPGHDTQVIDLIGYSRGAALARHFANQIIAHVQDGRFRYDVPGQGSITACVDLRFMGLFDTVAQIGLHGALNLQYDFSINPAWTSVAHAVALHEYRAWFPLSSTLSLQDGKLSNVTETPFIGAHANLGGGRLWSGPEVPADPGDLADVALNWMLWQGQASGIGWLAGPAADSQITLPILRDDRPAVLRKLYDGDRRVDDARGQWLVNRQGRFLPLGDPLRDTTEAFIRRFDDWQARDDTAVGLVDMAAYAQWLQDTIGWSPS